MTKIAISEALRRTQENCINKLETVKKNKIADSYYQVAAEDCATLQEKGVTAGIINNFTQIMDSDLGQAMTTSKDMGPYVMEVWPLVTAWYAEFPLKDLISVQDMDKPLGYLFFSSLKTGTSKSDTQVGDVVETALGQRKIKGRYPTGEIFGESITAAEIEFASATKVSQALLAYNPLNVAVIPGYLAKVKITVTKSGTTTSYTVLENRGGTLHLTADKTTDSGITLDVETGLITIPEASDATASTVTAITANYVWDLDYATTENIQKVKETIEMVPMEVIPRALALEWSLFSEYLKKSQYGQDMRTDNTKRILSLLYQYQVRYILDDMYDYATGNDGNVITVSLPNSSAISLDVKAQNVMQELKLAANIIELASGRIEGNRIVCGKNFKSFCESLPSTWFKISPSATNYGSEAGC